MEKAESSSLSTSGSNLLPTTLNNNDDNAQQKSFLVHFNPLNIIILAKPRLKMIT